MIVALKLPCQLGRSAGEKKAEVFRIGERALILSFAKFFSSTSQSEGQTSAPFWLGRAERNLSKFFPFSKLDGGRAGLVSLFLRAPSVEFSPQRKSTQPECISS